MIRPKAHSFEDGEEIQVNIIDENSSTLLTFITEEDYQNFCREIANLQRMGGENLVARIKIYCHTCEGKGTITEEKYPSKEEIEVPCPECNGEKWVWTTPIQEEG